MKMKYIKNFLLLSTLMTVLFACDSILDLNKEPLGSPSSATLFNTEQGIHMLLNSTYAYTRSFGFSGFGRFVAKEVGSDDTNPGSSPADGSVPRMVQVSNYTYLTSQGDLANYYSSNFTLIARANMVINSAPDVEMDETLKARYIGEAKFLRGLAYFNLVRGWGGVPIYTSVPDDPEEASEIRPRSSRRRGGTGASRDARLTVRR